METGKDQKRYKLNLGTLENLDHELPLITNIKDRFKHFYILGKTGAGKSVFMERMALYDINHCLPVIFLDPKGDSVRRLYHLIEDKSRVQYISIDTPIVINPLRKKDYSISNIIAEFVQILDVLITLTTSNPESTVLMREIISMALQEFPNEKRNLPDLCDFLLYENIRKSYKFTNPIIQKYWEEFDALDRYIKRNREKIESAKRVASRLITICEGQMLDFVVGENELNIRQIVEQNKVVLIDTSRMTYDKRIYLSNLIIYAIVSYCEFEKHKPNPLMVYVDEFQTVVSKLFSDLLGRSRSSKVGFVLAHHDFQEITPKVLSSVFGNVDNFVIFRCGDEEAKRVAGLFGLQAQDFINLDKYKAWLRLGTDNILIQADRPLMEEIPDIDIAPPRPSVNYLRDGYIVV